MKEIYRLYVEYLISLSSDRKIKEVCSSHNLLDKLLNSYWWYTLNGKEIRHIFDIEYGNILSVKNFYGFDIELKDFNHFERDIRKNKLNRINEGG